MAGTETAAKLARAWVRAAVEIATIVQNTLDDYLDDQDRARKVEAENRFGAGPAEPVAASAPPLWGERQGLHVVDGGLVKLEGKSWQFELSGDKVFLLLARERDHPHALIQNMTREQAADIVRMIGGAEMAAKSGL